MANAKKLPSGQWRTLAYSHTDADGKRKYESFTASTKKESEFLAAEFSLNKTSIKTTDYTLGEAMDNYCDSKSNVLSPSTIREYKRMRRTTFSDLADLKLKKISAETIQRFINTFALTHSPKTTHNAYGYLSTIIFTYAPGTPLNITLPQKVKPTLYVPTDSDIHTLLNYFGEYDKDMEIAVYLAAFGTLRRSETCAVTAEDIIDNRIRISKALVDKGDSEWVLKTTKTMSSTRIIEMPDFVISKLPTTGRLVPLNPDQVTRRFERALKQLKITPFRYHDLRHYAASVMHAIGVPDQYIMQRGGWSSDKTLKSIYRGTMQDYEHKFTAMTISHFDAMQHDMQHKKNKPQ